MKFISLILTFISLSSFAATDKLSAKDVMLKIDNNKIAFDIEPAIRRMVVAQLMSIGKLKTQEIFPKTLFLVRSKGLLNSLELSICIFSRKWLM